MSFSELLSMFLVLNVMVFSPQGWVFNVIPWFVSIPSSLFSGCLSDHLISKGQTSIPICTSGN